VPQQPPNPLTQPFFSRPTLTVAEELIGKFLVRKIGKTTTAYMITEVEAYDGFEDKASHAHKGETPRNRIMFGEAGYWYVYLCYGMYYMLNVVTGEKGYPAAILIRGVEGFSGPGRLTRGLEITKEENTKIALPESGLWIEDRGVKIPKSKIKRTPRIGVNYAKEWTDKPYRFLYIPEKD
jgi:DNA-3-methyladenine glycosylase